MCSIRKKIAAFVFTAFFAANSLCFSQVYASQQLIPAGHWIYDAMQVLHNATRKASFATNAPITVAELKVYLDAIPYEELTPACKKTYQTVFEFLTEKKKSYDIGGFFSSPLHPPLSKMGLLLLKRCALFFMGIFPWLLNSYVDLIYQLRLNPYTSSLG